MASQNPDPSIRPGTAVVTGASSGIGAAYARQLAARGHDLVLVARRARRLEELADELRRTTTARVELLAADLADPEGREPVLERLRQDDVTVLVNNAGINGYGPFDEADPAVLAQVLALNVTALTLLARAAVPGMRERGRPSWPARACRCRSCAPATPPRSSTGRTVSSRWLRARRTSSPSRSRRWLRPTWPARRWRRWAPARWSACPAWPTPRPSSACWPPRRRSAPAAARRSPRGTAAEPSPPRGRTARRGPVGAETGPVC
jgi:NAD(P)-dependent dehydrogenase (short-subunit alcohol dehydrogenase family)